MAGDWIKIRVDLHDDPAVIGAATLLGRGENEIVGALVRLWSWANQQTRDGNAVGVTAAWVDRYTGVAGLASALGKVGWLEVFEGGWRLPHYDRHNGRPAKVRAQTANRVQAHRTSPPEAPPAPNRNGPVALPALPSPQGPVTREEKRREEDNTQSPPSPQEGEKTGQARKKKKDAGPVVIPAELNTPEFLEAWGRWLAYRAEINKRLRPITLRRQLADLAGHGPAHAIATLDLSIRNGWQGLFPERAQTSTPAGRPSLESLADKFFGEQQS